MKPLTSEAGDYAVAAQHDLADKRMASDHLVPLSWIIAPTLIIHGIGDPICPLPHAHALAAHIPDATLRTISGIGHGFSPRAAPPDR
ncbi:MAG: alpha/beta fold hydrolase [Gammaproteobacteria bacterium]